MTYCFQQEIHPRSSEFRADTARPRHTRGNARPIPLRVRTRLGCSGAYGQHSLANYLTFPRRGRRSTRCPRAVRNRGRAANAPAAARRRASRPMPLGSSIAIDPWREDHRARGASASWPRPAPASSREDSLHRGQTSRVCPIHRAGNRRGGGACSYICPLMVWRVQSSIFGMIVSRPCATTAPTESAGVLFLYSSGNSAF